MSDKRNARQLVDVNWEFTGTSVETITCAAVLDAARTLRTILTRLDALGYDGLYQRP